MYWLVSFCSLSLLASPLASTGVSIITWATVTQQPTPPTCLNSSTCPRATAIPMVDTRCRGKQEPQDLLGCLMFVLLCIKLLYMNRLVCRMQPYGMVPPGSQQQFPGQGGMMGYPMQQGKNGCLLFFACLLESGFG